MKVMTDKYGETVDVGDCVFYGEKARNQGSRGVCNVGRITKIESRYATVSGAWSRMESSSFVKCSEKFADMYNSREIFKI